MKYYFITIDTEEDEWGSIGIRKPSVKNISHLKKLQEIFDEYGAIPTYLINYPVATYSSSRKVIEYLLGTGRCEIGTHSHPWNTPPFEEEQSKFNSFLCNLPQDLVEEKLGVLHEVIKNNFGINSVVFRAGRWGFGKKVLNAIEKLNYIVDTSITPFYSWVEKHGPDYKCRKNSSFYLNHQYFDEPLGRDMGKVLEIPPTMGYLQKNEIFCDKARKILTAPPIKYLKLNGIVDLVGLINYRWLSPEISSSDDMIRLANRQFEKGNNFVNMFFHSNSLMPGQTPFVSNFSELNAFYRKIELFLQYTVENNIKSLALSHGVVCQSGHEFFK